MEAIKNSPLYEVMKLMPKPAIHHAHITACASLDFLVSLTYKDNVYFSKKEEAFYVSNKGCTKEGYMKVNALR